MAFTLSYIIAAFLVSFVGVTIADNFYSDRIKWVNIFGGDMNDPIRDFCLDHHGATFKEGSQAKDCVDTKKGKKTTSLEITIEFTSILDESKAVNFTAEHCEKILMSVNYRSYTMESRGLRTNLDQRGSMENIQGRDTSVPPVTTVVALILQNSTTTTNQPAGTPETSLLFNSTAKCNYDMKAESDTSVPETVKITTTLPITLTIPEATHACSTSTITTTTTSNFISTTAKPATTTTTTTTITSSQSSSSSIAMNLYFTAKVKMDPNNCGCAHCN